MFEISVGFSSPNVHLKGLAALDERRRLGLPDGVELWVGYEQRRRAPVGESVARRHFGRSEVCRGRTITLELLAPGDLMPRPDCPDCPIAYVLAELSPERVRELWDLGE